MASYSPYGSTPSQEYFYDEKKFPSPSPTPSPRGPAYYFNATPQRPATRAHFRNGSTSGVNSYGSPRGPSFSPRYTSDGQYATANVSQSRSTRKPSFSGPRPTRERRNSFSYHRSPDPHGESDVDEFIEINGVTYVLPARSTSRRYMDYYIVNAGGHGTDYHYYAQGGPYFDRDAGYAPPRYEPDRRPAAGHARRNSTSVPQRPQTARPATVHKKPPPPPIRQATEADAKRHRIPPGYSLKNWDPNEEPIMLLGSVFDANSLGKWIYDWTVYHHGPATPISDMAGELWLLLIQLAGKIKRAEETVPKIRTKDNKEMVEEFIEAGDRITDKLRKLLKACEAPMLRSSTKQRKDGTQLGKNAGVEFVETLFGRERELEKTERFMASVRLWNLRFDTNCEEILRKPTM
ncbi:Vegetative cell wall protein gp1 [Madurella fahalii]|uniref:Vegetative cell wall protein gp1 n=1 Tax=Madurella fahalii TaxID=1157608 RepID=A0ABQ0GE80_9PEZI